MWSGGFPLNPCKSDFQDWPAWLSRKQDREMEFVLLLVEASLKENKTRNFAQNILHDLGGERLKTSNLFHCMCQASFFVTQNLNVRNKFDNFLSFFYDNAVVIIFFYTEISTRKKLICQKNVTNLLFNFSARSMIFNIVLEKCRFISLITKYSYVARGQTISPSHFGTTSKSSWPFLFYMVFRFQ